MHVSTSGPATYLMLESFVFFFQAEDGIRDSSVTGVQTCALPIYAPSWISIGSKSKARKHLIHAVELAPNYPENRLNLAEGYVKWSDRVGVRRERSEERRVGKECRSRWSPYH